MHKARERGKKRTGSRTAPAELSEDDAEDRYAYGKGGIQRDHWPDEMDPPSLGRPFIRRPSSSNTAVEHCSLRKQVQRDDALKASESHVSEITRATVTGRAAHAAIRWSALGVLGGAEKDRKT